ncbi:MAG: hypothetical protein IPK08_05945 [Bacteroidetes bacterium]|nr:hypothetical protein [Bacteroidota bacterium]
MERKLFFEYIFHPHLNITTKLKIDFLQIVIQLRSPEYYKEICSGKAGNIFLLIEQLNNFRNAIAHKESFYQDGNLIIGKKFGKFTTKTSIEEIEGVKNVKLKSLFHPVTEYYKVAKLEEIIIHAQIDIVNIFLKNYIEVHLEKQPESNLFIEVFNNALNNPHIFGKNAGVFGALKTDEQKQASIQNELQQLEKQMRVKQKNANKAKKKSSEG